MNKFGENLRRWWLGLPKLLRFLGIHCAIGVTAGWILLLLMVLTNTGGLRDLLTGSSNPLVPLLLLGAGFGITFGSASMGAAVMLLPYNDDEP